MMIMMMRMCFVLTYLYMHEHVLVCIILTHSMPDFIYTQIYHCIRYMLMIHVIFVV